MISTNAISAGDTAGIFLASHLTCDGLDNQSDRAKAQKPNPSSDQDTVVLLGASGEDGDISFGASMPRYVVQSSTHP